MGTTKSRKSRRNNSRPTAFSFLSNISLGTESEKPPDPSSIRKLDNTIQSDLFYIQNSDDGGKIALSLHSSESSFSAEDEALQASIYIENHSRNISRTSPSFITQQSPPKGTKHTRQSDSSSPEVEHFKLTREDSERPIASEKIKKKPQHGDRDAGHGVSIMSVFRYYTDKIRHSKAKQPELTTNRGYVQQQLESNNHHRRRRAESYARFLDTTGSLLNDVYIEEHKGPNDYDPYYLDDGALDVLGMDPGMSLTTTRRPADVRRELNEQFKRLHPEIPAEITLSKIRAIKLHLLEIGREVDLEVSSVAHAYVYFEKLVIKNMVTKKNRKLIAACCLFLATKVNEAKGTWFKTILDAMDTHLRVDAEEIHEHEFAVFADLEFNLYVPRREFMPHFETIFHHLEHKSISEYLGNTAFFSADQGVMTDEI